MCPQPKTRPDRYYNVRLASSPTAARQYVRYDNPGWPQSGQGPYISLAVPARGITSPEEKRKAAKRYLAAFKKRIDRGWDPFGKISSEEFEVREARPSRAAQEPVSRYAHPKGVVEGLRLAVEDRGILRKKTLQGYQSQLRILQEWLDGSGRQGRQIRFFTELDAREFMAELKRRQKHPTTYNQYRTNLHSWFETWVEQGALDTNPFRKIKRLPRNKLGATPFPNLVKEELRAWLNVHDPQLWVFTQFIYFTCVRPGELRQLRIRHIDFERGRLTVPGLVSKNKKAGEVDINPSFLEALLQRGYGSAGKECYIFGREGKPSLYQVGINAMGHRHRAMLKALALDKDRYQLYSWKHTGARNLAENGASLTEIQTHLRHQNPSETDNYLRSIGTLSGRKQQLPYELL